MSDWTHAAPASFRDDPQEWPGGEVDSCRDDPQQWTGTPASCRDLTGSEVMFGMSALNDTLLGSGMAETRPGWLVPIVESCRG